MSTTLPQPDIINGVVVFVIFFGGLIAVTAAVEVVYWLSERFSIGEEDQ